jgi:hypothetical protein
MLRPLFSSFALASLVAAGITCTPLFNTTGSLAIQLKTDDTLPQSTLSFGIDNELQYNGGDEKFIFHNCTSTVLDMAPAISSVADVYYG